MNNAYYGMQHKYQRRRMSFIAIIFCVEALPV